MTVEDLRDYCLSLPGVTEKMPWIGHNVYSSGLCFYICGKWFCFCDVDNFDFINIKLPPAMGEELRSEYDAVRPGWHMNKKYWNSIYPGRDLSDVRIKELIRISYDTVVAALPLKDRTGLMSQGATGLKSI